VTTPLDEYSLQQQAVLQAVRHMERIALCAADPRQGIEFESNFASLEQIAVLNREAVRDELLTRALSDADLTSHDKLLTVARRAAELAGEIESRTLPPGWTAHETISQRRYHLDADTVLVTINKHFSDHNRLTIRLYGWRAWSGYELGDCEPLSRVLDMAQSMRDDPGAFMSLNNQAQLAAAKRRYELRLPVTVGKTADPFVTHPPVAETDRTELEAPRSLAEPTDPRTGPLLESSPAVTRAARQTDPIDDRPLSRSDLDYEARTSLAASVQKTMQAWSATAARLQSRPPAERMIVLDTRGRAYTRHEQQSFKLQIPNTALSEVILLDRGRAEAAEAWLTTSYPQFSPYAIQDARAYAQTQRDETAELLTELQDVTNDGLPHQLTSLAHYRIEPAQMRPRPGVDAALPQSTAQGGDSEAADDPPYPDERSDEAPAP
jgi:hypothetical protein